ncbi:MAG TPA: ABC transporter permease [Blastocatellia bacterium]|nr:ABC transporter permease [Blastocatellia bacterium]
MKDISYGIRMMIKKPGFTAVAVMALALGIGANSSIFSVVNAVLLRPLPFKDPDRLVIVNETVRREGVEIRPASYPDFLDWRNENQSFDDIAAFDSPSFSLTGGDEPERVSGEIVSASYFPLLGIQPKVGRTFLPEEDGKPDANPVAVLSYKLWQRRFGSDPDLVGKTVKINDRDFTVVGVMPEGFEGVSGGSEVWVPMMMVSTFSSPPGNITKRGSRWHSVIARLKPGVTIKQAQADMDAIASRLEQEYQGTNKDRGVQLVGAHEAAVGDMRPTLMVLLGAVGFVLLIACANVANLLLARATVRQKEVAIRMALGASRGRLIRQLLTESVLLALAGGGLGLLLAVWGVDLLIAFVGNQIPGYIKPDIDIRVLGFTLLVSLMTGVVFGLVPALQASKPGLNELLKEGSRGSTGGARRHRVRRALVVTEVALALMLLIGAGLMLRSFQRLQAFNPGFEAENVITMRMNLPRRYTSQQASAFQQQLIERIQGLPGAQSVGLSTDVPLDGNTSATLAAIEGLVPPDDDIRVYVHVISPNFLATMGIPFLRGRDFGIQDNDQSPGAIIISESMARRLWPGDDPIGKRISAGRDQNGNRIWSQIVGVVGDVKYRTLIRDQNKDPDVYLPLLQNPDRALALAVRTQGDPSALASAIRGEVRSLDSNLPVFNIATMRQRMKNDTARTRFSTLLLGVFACVAMLLAVVGIYGVLAYSVTQRTHEIGIRMALGARRRDVLKLVVGEGMALVGAGVTIGLIGAFIATRVLASQLYSVSATDPVTFSVVSLLLAGVALGACFVPARRATNVDPMVALRYE